MWGVINQNILVFVEQLDHIRILSGDGIAIQDSICGTTPVENIPNGDDRSLIKQKDTCVSDSQILGIYKRGLNYLPKYVSTK